MAARNSTPPIPATTASTGCAAGCGRTTWATARASAWCRWVVPASRLTSTMCGFTRSTIDVSKGGFKGGQSPPLRTHHILLQEGIKMFNLSNHPHRRYNPLSREWVLVSPHRTQRPWQGQVEQKGGAAPLTYDPECYLCPGNARAGGVRNPVYRTTFVFDNDFAALKPGTGRDRFEEGDLLIAEA